MKKINSLILYKNTISYESVEIRPWKFICMLYHTCPHGVTELHHMTCKRSQKRVICINEQTCQLFF